MNMDKMSTSQRQYIRNCSRMKIIVGISRIMILVLFFISWEFSARTGHIDDFIFSSPSRILDMIKVMYTDNSLFHHIWVTLYETLISFAFVTLVSILIAIILWFSKSVSLILEPYLVILNSLPKSALAPVLIVWLGNTPKAIIVTAVSVAVFGTIISIYTGFCEVDTDKIRLVKTLGGHKYHIMTKVVIPSTIPIIISSMKVNIGLALVGVIIGEFLAANAGLGYLIIYGSQVFKMDMVLMSIIILCILAAVLYGILAFVEKLFKRYQ